MSDTDAMTVHCPRPRGRRAPGLLGALALATETADEIVLGTVRDVHGAVAHRVFGVAGRPPAAPPGSRAASHDRLSSAVYAGIGAGLRATSRGLRAADRRGLGARIEDSPAGRLRGLGASTA